MLVICFVVTEWKSHYQKGPNFCIQKVIVSSLVLRIKNFVLSCSISIKLLVKSDTAVEKEECRTYRLTRGGVDFA